MPNRRKVVTGLKCCTTHPNEYGDCMSEDCPYKSINCVNHLLQDALALLQAQEPETSDAPKSDNNVGCWYDITHNYTLEQVVSALKAQEPVEPIIDTYWETPSVYDDDVKVTENKCGACGAKIDKWDKYCRACGKAAKWDA